MFVDNKTSEIKQKLKCINFNKTFYLTNNLKQDNMIWFKNILF